MFLQLGKLAVLGLILMTIAYFAISIYSQSVRREKLEKSWDADNAEGGDADARDAFVERGMADYHSGLRSKLIWLVYVIPTVLVIGTLIATNWN